MSDQLQDELWGPDYGGEQANVAVFVHRLREKVEPDLASPVYVTTVWHVGYRFGN